MTGEARAAFAACLADVLAIPAAEVPVPARDQDPWVVWRGWLGDRALGLVPVDAPQRFGWPGRWLGLLGDQRAPVVLFGAPESDVVLDPLGAAPDPLVAGWTVAAHRIGDAARRAAPVTSGSVHSLFIAAHRSGPMETRADVEARPAGLVGDRYARGDGSFSHPDAPGTAVTLVAVEALEAADVDAAESRRNIVTAGVDLDGLIGVRFRVGDAVLLGRRRCEPCALLQRLTRPGVLRALVHRGGLRADVVDAGTIRVGDEVTA